jgi:DNA repair exonuclease SbcCD ATPase subunit
VLDLSQATQLLTWLDEEHRKDKALLMALQGQMDVQKTQLKEQARQLQDIEAMLARIEGQLPRLAQFEGAIENARTEFASLLARHAAEHETLEAARTQTEQQETETMARIIHQVQTRVEALGSFENTMAVLSDENRKLRGEVTKAFTQLSESSKRLDAQGPRIDLLEQDAQVFRDGLSNARLMYEDLNNTAMELKAALQNVGPTSDAKIEQLQSSFEAMNKRRSAESEALQGKQQEQARLVDELATELKALQTPVARWVKQMEEFNAQSERDRKTLYDLRELEKQIRQQANEMLELQRLEAERQRTELREWHDSQVRVDDEQTLRMEQVEAWRRKATETLQSLEDRLEQNKLDTEALADRLWQTWAEYIQGHTKFLENVVKQRGAG